MPSEFSFRLPEESWWLPTQPPMDVSAEQPGLGSSPPGPLLELHPLAPSLSLSLSLVSLSPPPPPSPSLLFLPSFPPSFSPRSLPPSLPQFPPSSLPSSPLPLSIGGAQRVSSSSSSGGEGGERKAERRFTS